MASLTALELNCSKLSVRELNAALRELPDGSVVNITEPRGRHNLAVGLSNKLEITISGNAGYFIGGCATGPTSPLTASSAGRWRRTSCQARSGCAGTPRSAQGRPLTAVSLSSKGTLRRAAAISLKGGTIAVGGDVGHMSGFMAQAGTLSSGATPASHSATPSTKQ